MLPSGWFKHMHAAITHAQLACPPHAAGRGWQRTLSGRGVSLYVISQYVVVASQSCVSQPTKPGGTAAQKPLGAPPCSQ
jgi:hypothetical protein